MGWVGLFGPGFEPAPTLFNWPSLSFFFIIEREIYRRLSLHNDHSIYTLYYMSTPSSMILHV